MLKRRIALTSIAFAMLTATAIAQTSAPGTTSPAPSPGMSSSSDSSAKTPEQNLAGQGKWRASKLMGVDIYGPDNKKVGDITEVLFDKTGKIEMVTVGVGGFLGIGAKDVAIPFDQVTWSDQPMAAAAPAPSAAPSPAPAGGAGTTGGGITSTPSNTAAAPKAPEMYPDHGKISMSKEQLSAAPAVSYASR